MYINEIRDDSVLGTALANFSSVADANSAALSLSPDDIAEIQDASADFTAKLNAKMAAAAAAISATADKDAQKHTSKGVISKWARKFRADPSVSDALLSSLMLPPHVTPAVKTAATTPTSILAVSDVDGNVRITWNRNGNRFGTVFMIEVQTSPTGAWSILSSTTKAKFDTRATVGSYIAYRITAGRGDSFSAPSTPFFLWAGGGLALAA